jgi:hypothetical protein
MADNSIIKLFKSDHAVTALYLSLLAGAFFNFIPDPTDALQFYLERKWRIQLEKKEITPKAFWEKRLESFYLIDSVWWLVVLGIVILFGKGIEQKAWIAGGIIGGGAVIGIIFSNIKKDTEFFEEYELVKK